ncbi:hemerythrin domain-containing protein [Glycomyces tarimensis]
MVGDVVDLIMQDHREVERLFSELKQHPEKRPLLTPVLSALLIAHSRAEEAEVYPVAKDEAGETEEVSHSQREHAQAEQLLMKLVKADPQSSKYEDLLGELEESITHHVEEEESTVLPQMRERIGDDRRAQLGEAFATSRAEHLGEQPGEATKEELQMQARNAGLSGTSNMGKEEIMKELQSSS